MTNEMNRLRDHRDAQPSPTPQVVAAARARLADQARRTAHKRVHRTPSRARRYALATAACVAAAVAVAVPAAFNGRDADRAYAAERQPNGTIKVTLREFTDSAGLQRRLDALGVRAAVDYLPPGLRCAEGRATVDDTVNPQPEVIDQPDSGRLEFYIHAERIRPGQTLVWTMSYDQNAPGRHRPYAVGILTYLARGPVKPCEPIPQPNPGHQIPRGGRSASPGDQPARSSMVGQRNTSK